MKSILLASASVVAFAGAAAAEVTFGGDATLGWNDDVEDGFYWDAGVDVTMSQTLDNGLTASATFSLNVVENDLGEVVSTSGYVLSLTSDMGGLYFGDVDPVADDIWSGVDGSAVPGFNDQDVHFDVADFEAMLRGELTMMGINAYMSYGVELGDGGAAESDLDALQLAATGDFGGFGFIVAYQEEFGPTPMIFGVAATGSFAGADVKVAYEMADDTANTSSIGVDVSYPLGPVVVGGYYTINMEDGDIDNDAYGVEVNYANGPVSVDAYYDGSTNEADEGSFGVEGSYDVGNGLMVYAGYILDMNDGTNEDGEFAESLAAYYAAVTMDLGGGASALFSYAEDETAGAQDEIGDPEYLEGMTLEVSFEF